MDELETTSDQARPRKYWAQRHGGRRGRIGLGVAIELFRSTVTALDSDSYYQEWTGYSCVDAGEVVGTGGDDPEAYAYRKTRLEGLWPPGPQWNSWDLDHLLTAVEFFFDVVSEPSSGYYHSFSNCGYHASTFSRHGGRLRYKAEVNEFLGDLEEGFELSAAGVVERKPPAGVEMLLDAALPSSAGTASQDTLAHAVAVFRARGSTERDQLDALRNLAAILESLRPELKSVFRHKDEADLFEIANRFNLRHADVGQRTDYDRSVFFPWVFYSYLAAIHAAHQLIERTKTSRHQPPSTG